MSLRHIVGRDIEQLDAELAKIEARWRDDLTTLHAGNPEYRRDRVLADILSLKIDVFHLATSFSRYEAISLQYDELLCSHEKLLQRVDIMQHTMQLWIRLRAARSVSTNVDGEVKAV